MIQYFHMAYQYNDVSLTYNAITSTYNGDPLGVLTVNVFDIVQLSENITPLQDLLVFEPAPYIESLFTHYKWNDNAANQVIVDSIGGVNGVWAHGTTASNSTTGKINEALSFNGIGDYMSAPDTYNFNLTTFSYTAWLQNSTVGIFEQRILSKKLSTTDVDGYEISLYYDGTDYYLKVVSGSSFTSFDTGVDWSAGDWHQIVVIFDGTTAYAYCDNIYLGSGGIDLILPNTNNLLFGKIDDEAVTIWIGNMDDTRFYNKKLTLGEIDFLWNSGDGTEYDSEYLAISEYINVSMTSSNSIFDTVELSEEVALEQVSFIDVYSSLELSEDVTVRSQFNLDIYDTIEISEEITTEMSQLGDIDVYSTINISEDIIATNAYNIPADDTLNISEEVTMEMSQLGDINVYDSLDLSENFVDAGQLTVDVYDSIDTSEDVTILLTLEPNIYSTLNLSEEVTLSGQLGDIDIYDSLEISEYIQLEPGSGVDVYDSVELSEEVTLEQTSFIDVYGELNLSEEVTLSGQLGDIDVYDELDISEDIAFGGQLGSINVHDVINLSENFFSSGVYRISVNDTLNISESIIVYVQLGDITSYDTLNLSEEVSLTNALASINVNDSIAIADVVTNSGQLYISVSDELDISTNFTPAASILKVSVNDQISLSEVAATEMVVYLSVFDSITISELVTVESFRFSPADSRPVGRINTMRPVANLSGYA